MAVDLGTAYISVVPTTKDIDKGIRQALDNSVKHSDKAGREMGERIADNVTKQVGKAGDRSGEAFSRGFGPRVQSAGRSALQGLSNFMVGGAQGIGSELGGGISAGMTNAINKGAVEAIDSLAAIGTRGGGAMSSKLQTAGMLAAGGVALVGTAAIAATAELYKIGAAWDDISDGITSKTGLIGQELAKVTDSVKKVALDTAAAPGDIARVTAELVQTLKLSGEDLERVTKQISDYNEMNKDAPINVREFAKAMKQFGITSADEMSRTLDRLNNVAQNTGIPLNNLIASLRSAAPVAREFKMPLAEVTQLLATFEDAGLNAESAATLLKLALGNLANTNPSSDPVVALQEVITKIQELSAAGRDLEAIDLAKSTFGRSWDQILPLIKENKLEVDNLNTSTAALGPTIEEQRKATADFTEEWRKFRNFLEVELAPAAEIVFNGISTLIKGTLGVAAQNIRDIRSLFGGGDGADNATAMIPGGGLANASRERRGLGPADPTGGLLGGAFGAGGGGMPGTAGRGYMNSGAASNYLDQQTALGSGGLIGTAGNASSALAAAPSLSWANIDAIAANRGLTMTSGYRDPNGPTLGGVPAWRSYHGSGRARDYAGTPAQNAAFYNFMKNTYGSQLKELLYEDVGTANEHVHVAYDTGGWLPPGKTNVVNNTGEPELILNPEQVQELARQGLDPNSLLHGTTNKAAPGPTGLPDESNRTAGFVPVAASNTGVAGTSIVSSMLNMGSEAIGGLIDAGAQAAQLAAAAALAGTSGGSGAAAAPAAGAGIQIAAQVAKRGVSYGFQLAGIGADSLIEQLFPFGAPRWLGYDYTAFAPNMGGMNTGVTTLEKAQNQAAGQPVAGQDAGGPVNPATMPGMATPITEGAGPTAPTPGPMTSTGQPLTAIPTSRNMNPDMSTLTEANVLQRMMGYDQGGMLPPGGVGINMTNRPEPVLTPQQWDALASNVPDPAGGSPLVKIDNIYGINADDVANKIEAKQKLAMMRYAGRP